MTGRAHAADTGCMPLHDLIWRKASRSGENGGDCVELAGLPDHDWRKGTQSGPNGGNCVEVAAVSGVIAVRDSKDPNGPVLLLTRDALRTAIRSAPTRTDRPPTEQPGSGEASRPSQPG